MFGARVKCLADPSWGCHDIALMFERARFLVAAFGAVVVDAVGVVSFAFSCFDLSLR